MMRRMDEQRLVAWLDGDLPEDEAIDVAAWADRDAEARRVADAHWSLVKEVRAVAAPPPASPWPGMPARRRRRAWHPRVAEAMAAAALMAMGAGLLAWPSKVEAPADPGQRQAVAGPALAPFGAAPATDPERAALKAELAALGAEIEAVRRALDAAAVRAIEHEAAMEEIAAVTLAAGRLHRERFGEVRDADRRRRLLKEVLPDTRAAREADAVFPESKAQG
jgi:hypothetical protein